MKRLLNTSSMIGSAWVPMACVRLSFFAPDRLHRHRFHHHLLATIDEAEARLVGFLEGALHRGQGACAPYECSVGPSVADMRAHEDFDLPRRHALAGDFGFH